MHTHCQWCRTFLSHTTSVHTFHNKSQTLPRLLDLIDSWLPCGYSEMSSAYTEILYVYMWVFHLYVCEYFTCMTQALNFSQVCLWIFHMHVCECACFTLVNKYFSFRHVCAKLLIYFLKGSPIVSVSDKTTNTFQLTGCVSVSYYSLLWFHGLHLGSLSQLSSAFFPAAAGKRFQWQALYTTCPKLYTTQQTNPSSGAFSSSTRGVCLDQNRAKKIMNIRIR